MALPEPSGAPLSGPAGVLQAYRLRAKPTGAVCNKGFFHHIAEPMQAMAGLLVANGAPAETIDDGATADVTRGRTAPCTWGSGRTSKHCRGDSSPQAASSAAAGRLPETQA